MIEKSPRQIKILFGKEVAFLKRIAVSIFVTPIIIVEPPIGFEPMRPYGT